MVLQSDFDGYIGGFTDGISARLDTRSSAPNTWLTYFLDISIYKNLKGRIQYSRNDLKMHGSGVYAFGDGHGHSNVSIFDTNNAHALLREQLCLGLQYAHNFKKYQLSFTQSVSCSDLNRAENLILVNLTHPRSWGGLSELEGSVHLWKKTRLNLGTLFAYTLHNLVDTTRSFDIKAYLPFSIGFSIGLTYDLI